MTRPLTTAVLQARDIILECLLVRKGALLTEMVCRERANNCAQALMELLDERGAVVSGEIETSDGETMEDHARRVIK